MNKWIEDQAGGQLVELKDNVTIWSEIDEEDEEQKVLFSWLECNKYVLGNYATYERCQEILQDIKYFMFCENEMIFKMPKE